MPVRRVLQTAQTAASLPSPRTLADIARLARWLGPWAHDLERPDVIRERSTVPPTHEGERPIPLWIYAPRRRPRGSYLLIQGLHYAGPRDPRMDRFARVLAHAGYLVFAPEIPDYIALRVQRQAIDDIRRVFRFVLTHPDRPRDSKPGVFTISFGSLLGLALAADSELGDRIDRLIIFGGYLDWETTIRFCMTGEVNGEKICSHDPLNLPVLFIHAQDQIDDDFFAGERGPVLRGWRQFVKATWGREHYKRGGRHHRVAERIATRLPTAQREPYLVGTGTKPGARPIIEEILDRQERGTLEHLDARPWVPDVRCPVHVVHGSDDDVIPYTEAEALVDALSRHTEVKGWMTGMYGHTATDASTLLSNAAQAGREIATMLGMLHAVGSVGR